jgi:hypothetical protein
MRLSQKGLLVSVVMLGSLFQQVYGQAAIQPQVPQAGLVQKTQLWNLSVSYMLADNPLVVMDLVVKDRVSNQPVLTGRSAAFRLSYGVQMVTEASAGPVTYTYSSPTAEGGSGLLAAGLYEACYQILTPDQKTTLGDACTAIDVEAMSPPQLSLPEDSAVLLTQYPQFSWLPPVPVSLFPALRYDLLVTEVLVGQTAQEALQRNTPLFSTSALTANMLVYPSGYPMPDTGRYYAWQVTARNGDTYGAKSEVWVFRVANPSPEMFMDSAVYFPRLTKKVFDAVHNITDPVRFEFVNEGNEPTAVIRLFRTTGGRKELLASKAIKVSPGQNFITWDAGTPAREDKEQLLTFSLLLPSGQEWGCIFRVPAR